MRHWILRVLPKLNRRTPRAAQACRPTLEQLEDRCVPSASPMQPMGMGMGMPPMGMPPMGMQTMSAPPMNMGMSSSNMMNMSLNANTMAALHQLFTDFDQTLRVVMLSKTLPQFFANEMHMRQVVVADLVRVESSLMNMG